MMSLVPLMLAASDAIVFDSLRSGFQQPKLSMLALMLAVPFLVLIGTMAWLYLTKRRQFTEEELDSNDELFSELSVAHGLSSAEKAELQSLAHAWSLESPAHLFVRPDLFAADWASSGDVSVHDRQRIDHFRSRLFEGNGIGQALTTRDGGEKVDLASAGKVAEQTSSA